MILKERLALATNYISILERLRGRVGDARALDDPVLRGAVERYLHLAVESLIDVGMRLCSLLRLRKPEVYRDVARVLGDSGVLSKENAERFELWIGLRNILVHGYARLDPERLLQALQEVEECKEIARRLASFISERSIDPGGGGEVRDVMERVRGVLEGRKYIVFAYVFGSRVHGRYAMKGDVDVAIYTEEGITWRELADTTNALEDELKCGVDLVHLNTAPLSMVYEVVAGGVVILDRRPEERVDYEVRRIREYLDIKPRIEEYFKTVLGA